MSDKSDNAEYYSKEEKIRFKQLDNSLIDLQGTICRNKKSDPIYFCDYSDEDKISADVICFIAKKMGFYADYKNGKIYIHDINMFSQNVSLPYYFRIGIKKVFEDVFQPISYNDRLLYPFHELFHNHISMNEQCGPWGFTCNHRVDLDSEYDKFRFRKHPVIAVVIISMMKREAGLELIKKCQEKFDTEYFILIDFDQEKLTRTIFLFELGNEILKDEQNLYANDEIENEILLTTLPFKKSVLLKRASSYFVNNYDSVEEIIEVPITIWPCNLRRSDE